MKERQVLVIPLDKLNSIIPKFTGFSPVKSNGLVEKIERNAIWLNKNEAEKNKKFKQLIGYTVVFSSSGNEIFVYKRAKNDAYKETLLQGRWSCGIGGHVEQKDGDFCPITTSVHREIREEVKIKGGYSEPNLLGFINDDDEVGNVHFGLLYFCDSKSEEIVPIDKEIEKGKFMSIKGLQGINNLGFLEGWSKISTQVIKKNIFLGIHYELVPASYQLIFFINSF